MNGPENEITSDGISRRGVIKTAAWSTPVIALAMAAPAAAASGGVIQTTYHSNASAPIGENSGALSGTFSGGVGFVVTGNPGDTALSGAFTIVYELEGYFADTAITWDDSSTITFGQDVTISGVLWTVASVSTTAVVLTAPPQVLGLGLTTIEYPTLAFTGTYTGDYTVAQRAYSWITPSVGTTTLAAAGGRFPA